MKNKVKMLHRFEETIKWQNAPEAALETLKSYIN